MRAMRWSLILCLLAGAPVGAASRPNVVLLMTDDQGYGDLSCTGNPRIKTPEMDRLQAESIRLTDYHVSPTCSPTRAALVTGHWTNRTGVWHTISGRSLLRANEVTFGQLFKDAGYATGMFGKWHMGDNYPYRAEDRGFDEVLRHGGGGVSQTPDYWDNAYFDGSYFHNSRPEAVKGFCTDVWFRYATDFIRKQHAAGRPFFTYLATNAPHGPMHSPTAYSAPYADLGVNVANFYGMIANIDENLGRLRRFLHDEGLERDTIFIFTTDNGTSTGHKVYNAGMRGHKGSAYDGGHRVPFFLYWPGGGLTGGRDVTPITAHVDVVPTLLDLCGIPQPEGLRFDGRSLRPVLEGRGADWPDRILVTDSQRVIDPIKWRQSSVMTSRWRLINGKELYDMPADPGQQRDVAAQHEAVVRRLRDFYEAWWAELEPTFKQDCPLTLGDPHDNPARLTCHDWIGDQGTPWHQGHVRAGKVAWGNRGYWNVRVARAGTYRIALRRWPRESGAALGAALPPGPDVPGVKALRAQPGVALPVVRATLRIAGQSLEVPATPAMQEAVFTLHLEPGVTRLEGRLYGDATHFAGAHYAYVERLTD